MFKEALLGLAMQCAPQVHPDTILDVARTESGLNPFAIAEIVPKKERVNGKSVISYLPKNRDDALSIIKNIEQKKRRFSVGLMQITNSNYPNLHTNAELMLDPCNNLKAFQVIIKDCYLRGKTLKNAVSCYYSGNFSTGYQAENEFRKTSYVERIGYKKDYVVPSTKEDQKKEVETKRAVKIESEIIYPDYVIRGIATTS